MKNKKIYAVVYVLFFITISSISGSDSDEKRRSRTRETKRLCTALQNNIATPESIRESVRLGADADGISYAYKFPILIAVECGIGKQGLDNVRTLIELGALMTQGRCLNTTTGKNIFHIAAMDKKKFPILQYLVAIYKAQENKAYDADYYDWHISSFFDEHDLEGHFPLSCAVEAEHLKSVKLLSKKTDLKTMHWVVPFAKYHFATHPYTSQTKTSARKNKNRQRILDALEKAYDKKHEEERKTWGYE